MSPSILRRGLVLLLWGSAFLASEASAEEEVRIAIAAGVKRMSIAGRDLAVYDADVGDRLASGSGAISVTVRGVKGGVTASGRKLKLDDGKFRARQLIFEAQGGVRVQGRLYLGRVAVGRAKGRLLAINRLPLETYLLGIVGSEMSPAWPPEALKAQAVAARTYAMQRRVMMRAADRPYDLESSVLSQVYTGAERIRPSVEQAVASTHGEVMAHRHRLVEALYHSTCGGETVPAEEAFGRRVSYLRPRKCRWCKTSTRYRWSVSFPIAQVSAKLASAKLVAGAVSDVSRKVGHEKVSVKVGGKAVHVSPRALRKALGFGKLYSARFTAKTSGGKVRFKGRGFGHGVGMCQWGARGLALEGRNYREILGHYYKGSSIARLY